LAAAQALSGKGGVGFMAGGNGNSVKNATSIGTAGTKGGGGSGGCIISGGASQQGGAGGDGVLRVWEFA
jgi:hypothetical protein